MLKFKTFYLPQNSNQSVVENEINEFFEIYHKILSPQGINVFETRVVVVYDDSSKADRDVRFVIENFENAITKIRLDIELKEKALFFARRAEPTVTFTKQMKKDGIKIMEGELSELIAQVSYLEDRLKSLAKF